MKKFRFPTILFLVSAFLLLCAAPVSAETTFTGSSSGYWPVYANLAQNSAYVATFGLGNGAVNGNLVRTRIQCNYRRPDAILGSDGGTLGQLPTVYNIIFTRDPNDFPALVADVSFEIRSIAIRDFFLTETNNAYARMTPRSFVCVGDNINPVTVQWLVHQVNRNVAEVTVNVYDTYGTFGTWTQRGNPESSDNFCAIAPEFRVATYTNPLVTSSLDITHLIGDAADWNRDVTGTWGKSTNKKIPGTGTVECLTLIDGTDPSISTAGTQYDQVGHRPHSYRLKDNDSIGTQYPKDNTYTDTNRWITVVTEDELDFEAYLQGTTTKYDGSYWLAASGATADLARRTTVDLKASTDTPGEYDFTIKKGATQIVSEYKDNLLANPLRPGTTTASKLNYDTDSPTDDGEKFTSVLLAHGYPTVELSPETKPAKVVKIDSKAPNAPTVTTPTGVDKWSTIAPSATDVGASGVPSVEEDGYYYKFFPAGTTGVSAPSGNDGVGVDSWTSVREYTKPTESGKYDLYVYAKDRATNRSAATMVNPIGEPIEITSEVKMKKTTTQGATIHGEGCTDYDSVDIGDDCEGNCLEGSQKEIMQNSTLTYKLELENTDLTKTATGSFEDLLPEGIDTTTPPTLTPGAGVSGLMATLDNGRWKVTGNYSLTALMTTDVTISCKAPLLKDVTSESKVITNQAELNYEIGTGLGAITGTAKSNYANHRINAFATISKLANNEAALHAQDCPNSTSLEKIAGCKGTCVAGNTGLVEAGYIITYKLSFENPSETTQYFATDAARFYDQMPAGVSIAEQDWSVELTGNGTYSESDTTPATGKGSVSAWSDANGNSLTGLSFDATNNGVVQDGNTTISLAPGAKLEVTVKAKVTDAGSDNLVNQVKSGYKLDGDNNTALTTADAEVIAINSNYTTHERAIFGVDTKFTKVGADDLDVPLAGAKFALYKWLGTTAEYAGHEDDILDIALLNGGEASDNWLRATTDGADGTTSDVFTTLADGEIDLGKLPDGIYTLIETKAPDGYELPVGQWVLTINNSKGNTGDGDYKIEYTAKGEMLPPAVRIDTDAETGDLTYQVVNVRPFSIGMSGMNGTKGITILGLAIMLIAGISYSIYNLKKSRKSRKKR